MSLVLGGSTPQLTFTDSTTQSTAALPLTGGTVTGEIICASGVGGYPCFSGYLNASQSISTNTQTKVTIDTKTFDTNGCYNNTSSTATLNGLSVPAYSFCPNVAGYYQVIAACRYYPISVNAGTANNEVLVSIWKNGSEYARANDSLSIPIASTGALGPMVSTILYLNGTGDYINYYTYQSYQSSASLSNQSQMTFFNACLIRGA